MRSIYRSYIFSKISDFFSSIYGFFPLQLLINNIKKNQILILFWAILAAIVTDNFGSNLGVPYLLLDPEYMGKVNHVSMAIVGVTYGIFVISYFITSYILDSYRFSVLATMRYPFVKFCVNNSFFPIAFLILYLYEFFNFQFEIGFESKWEIVIEAATLVGSFVLTTIVIILYFRYTNKDIFRELASNIDDSLKRKRINAISMMKKLKEVKKKNNVVTSYLDTTLIIRKVDSEVMYNKRMLLKVFDQHHLNAVSVEILVFISILLLGFFKDNPVFQIPAGASMLLLFSFIVMFTGAFSYWLRGWAISGLIVTLVLVNFLVKQEVIGINNAAYGINYKSEKSLYNLDRVKQLSCAEFYKSDVDQTIQILENWKLKFPAGTKPKMVFVCSSGGGQRAATWTVRTMQHVDSMTNGAFFNNTVLLTGASGGLIGASYFRELYLQKKLGHIPSVYSPQYLDNMAKDMLNPIVFSLVVSDLFLRFQFFKLGKYEYYKGRGYAFEQQLNMNTNHVLDRKVMDYKEYEQKAMIPMVIMAPTVINTGRKLYIASQPVSYMNHCSPELDKNLDPRIKALEFMRFFKDQDAENLLFTSALRMSATFPYVTPNVSLPSSPRMEIMDAGLSDNFGITDAVRFMYTFRKWINENTSGVVVVSIRDSDKNPEVKIKDRQSAFQKIVNPIGSLYSNWDNIQDFTNDNALEFANTWFNGNLDLVTFQYIPKPKTWDILIQKKVDVDHLEAEYEKERASLSWHLTKREKESIRRTILEQNNQKSLDRLSYLLR